MSFLDFLFGGGSVEKLLGQLERAQQNGDLDKTAELLYKVGEKYLKDGKEEKAYLYISLFDELVGNDDHLCTKFEKKEDKASDLIGEFEEKNFFAKQMRDMVSQKAEELDPVQMAQWNLLTMARLNTLFGKLSKLSGFEKFGGYEKAIDIISKAVYGDCDDNEKEFLTNFITNFSDSVDIKTLINPNIKVTIPNGADFKVVDLTSDSLLLNLYLTLDKMICIVEGKPDNIDTELVTNALHTGYYIRTRQEDLHNIKALQGEKDRILSDYEFILNEPDEQQFNARMAEYKKLMLPA